MLSSALEWAKTHPETVIFLLGLLTSLFNWVTKPRTPEELAKFSPRVAAFFRAMNALFPDPEKFTEALWQAWNNTHGRLPSKTGSTISPPPPSNDDNG